MEKKEQKKNGTEVFSGNTENSRPDNHRPYDQFLMPEFEETPASGRPEHDDTEYGEGLSFSDLSGHFESFMRNFANGCDDGSDGWNPFDMAFFLSEMTGALNRIADALEERNEIDHEYADSLARIRRDIDAVFKGREAKERLGSIFGKEY